MYSGFCTSDARTAAPFSSGRTRSTKNVGILAERQQRDAARIVHVLVEHARDRRPRERVGERRRVGAAAEREQLHEQPVVGSLRLSVLHAAFFAESGGSGPRRASCRLRHALSIIRGPCRCRPTTSGPRRSTTPTCWSGIASAMFTDMGVAMDAAALERRLSRVARRDDAAGHVSRAGWSRPASGDDRRRRRHHGPALAARPAVCRRPAGLRLQRLHRTRASRAAAWPGSIMDAIHAWCRQSGHRRRSALNASRDGLPLYESMGYRRVAAAR